MKKITTLVLAAGLLMNVSAFAQEKKADGKYGPTSVQCSQVTQWVKDRKDAAAKAAAQQPAGEASGSAETGR